MTRRLVIAIFAFLSMIAALSIPATPADAASIFDRPLNLYNVATKKCADIPGLDKGQKDGPVNEYGCDYTRRDNQRFYLQRHGSYRGYPQVLIKNKTDGLCLDLPYFGSVAPGTPVTEFRCYSKGDNQLYYLKPGAPGTYFLVNRASGLCLDVANVRTGGDDARLTVWRCATRDDHLWAFITKPTQIVSDLYAQAYMSSFRSLDEDVAEVHPAAPKTNGDGLVAARFFIPSANAAHGLLRGDNRPYSSDPWASSRFAYAWDLHSGKSSLRVFWSTTRTGAVLPAFGLRRLTNRDAVLNQGDIFRINNYYHTRSRIFPDNEYATLTVSAVNSLTGDRNGAAWSSDGEISLIHDKNGAISAYFEGNSYPQMEVVYYPRGKNTAVVVARRDINPYALTGTSRQMDASGGAAAIDTNSWVFCENPATSTREVTCDESSGWTNAQPSWTTRW